jgi:hypothetical protein
MHVDMTREREGSDISQKFVTVTILGSYSFADHPLDACDPQMVAPTIIAKSWNEQQEILV